MGRNSNGRKVRLEARQVLCGGELGVGFGNIFGVHKTRVKWDKLSVGVGEIITRDGGLVIWAKPTRIEDFRGIPRGVWWKFEEVGDWGDNCLDLVGTCEARGQAVVVACMGTSGFRKHPNEDPVADVKLRVATMAICLHDAFFGCQAESRAGLFPILFHA